MLQYKSGTHTGIIFRVLWHLVANPALRPPFFQVKPPYNRQRGQRSTIYTAHSGAMFALLTVLVNVAATAVSAHGLISGNQLSSGCDTSGPASCSIRPPPSDGCCYESPGGLLLQTQFWETHPSTGPSDSWTIHGLWADHCDGTFPPKRGCDPSRDYTDIAGLLRDQGAGDTLSYMERYWVDYHGQNEHFWEHEWDNHGTCYNTLRPSCLPPDSPEGAEAVAYFQQVVALFQTLPTYNWLAKQGITPHPTRSHTLTELTDALKAASGFTPALECVGSVLNQVYWYFNLRGSLLDGEFVPIDSPIESKCPSHGIKYPPKSGFSDSTFQVPLNGPADNFGPAHQPCDQ